jgi:hypothetical protein
MSVTSKRRFLMMAMLGLTTCGLTLELLPISSIPVAQAGLPDLLMSMFRGRPSRGTRGMGGRGEGFCLLSPLLNRTSSERVATVWNDRPAFVWQGNLEWIEIRSADGNPLGPRLDLSQVGANESLHDVTLDEPLQPGGRYSFVVKAPKLDAFLPINLQIMEAPEREQVTADLQALAAQGGTAEDIAVRQANYFADRQLWADFWQTLLAVEQPSAELKAALEEEINTLCGTGG